MSPFGVHDHEMPNPRPLDDVAVEAFLTGRATPGEELAPLMAFTEDVRVVVDAPPPAPSPALAALMTRGLSSPPERAPLATPVIERRKRMNISDLISGLPAKLAALGLAAKASLGVGVATVGIAAAGTAGVLPDGVQHNVAQVVESTTGLEIPDPLDDVVPDDLTNLPEVPDVDLPDTDVPELPDVGDVTDDLDDVTDDVTDDDGQSADRKDNHGACVSAAAHQKPTDGSSHGKAVSQVARSDCGKDGQSTDSPDVTTPTIPDVDDESSERSNQGPGKGNGNANGQGNRGPGSSSGNRGPGNK